MTPREARALAKVMFRELAKIPPRVSDRDNVEFFERAAVLADVVLESDRPDVGEALALAVRGRVTSYSGRFGGKLIGTPLPPGTEATELANAIAYAGRVLFPPRRAPCMPNRADLRRLIIEAHGEDDHVDRPASEWLRRVWLEMKRTCGGARSMFALETANSAIRGHGVESMVYRTHDGDDVVGFDYVNTGDTYSETVGLIYEAGLSRSGFIYEAGLSRSRRFLVTTRGDVAEQTERRFRERGEWGQW